MIEIENVSLVLGGTRVLDEITLSLPKGGVTALVGPNGAGKSTLLSLIARLLPLQTGRIRVDGLAVDRTSGRDLAKKLAILRQDAGAMPRLRVRELVGFGRFPHSRGRLVAADHAAIQQALDLFDLESLADRFIDTLSGGQRQRALVAMAFCQDTDYLLLDEPLNNLDMRYARDLMRTLRHLSDTHGKTVLIVLHDINHAAAHADRIIALKDGRVIANGDRQSVICPSVLEIIFGYSIKVADFEGRAIVLHHA